MGNFLQRLDIDSLILLDAAIYYNHKKHIVVPQEPNIMPFNAAAEMSRLPESEEHFKETR